MISDSLKRWLSGEAASGQVSGHVSGQLSKQPLKQFAEPQDTVPRTTPGEELLRRSNGLREFFAHIDGQQGLKVLDLGPASQANINFITSLGHTIFHEDLYPEFSRSSWDSDRFLAASLNYPEALFDAVLCWDTMDQLPEPAAASQVVARLGRITKPGGVLVLFFHTAQPDTEALVYRSQICAADCLRLFPRGKFRVKRPLNNRNIENLFRDFHALKFFLTRDHLREVLAIR